MIPSSISLAKYCKILYNILCRKRLENLLEFNHKGYEEDKEPIMRRKRPPCRVATMNVSSTYFREPRRNPQRIQFAQDLLRLAQSKNVDCLCFPAGYLTTCRAAKVTALLEPLTRTAWSLGVSFVLGIDLACHFPDANSAEFMEIVRKGKMPCLLAAFDAARDLLSITRQRSCTSEQARRKLVPDEVITAPRMMDLGGACFQIIHCGEVYDRRLFGKDIPNAQIVFGHLGMVRLAVTLAACAQRGFSLINTEHRIGKNGILFCYDNGGINKSRRGDIYAESDNGLWAEMAVWTLGRGGRFCPAR